MNHLNDVVKQLNQRHKTAKSLEYFFKQMKHKQDEYELQEMYIRIDPVTGTTDKHLFLKINNEWFQTTSNSMIKEAKSILACNVKFPLKFKPTKRGKNQYYALYDYNYVNY